MKRVKLYLSITALSLLMSLGITHSVVALEFHGGQVCQSILIPQAVNLNYTKAGVTNIASIPFWVNCTLTVDFDNLRNSTTVYVEGAGVNCIFRESITSAAEQQIAFKIDVAVGSGPPFFAGAPAGPHISSLIGSANIACKLPPGATLELIQIS